MSQIGAQPPLSLNALPSGTNTIGKIELVASTAAIGKLAVNSGVTIGAVEIAASQTLATVTNLAQLGGSAIAMNTGVRTAGTQRVTIATDDVVPASQSGTWNINSLTSITNALPAGSNTIGNVGLVAGTATVGNVGLVAGSATIGNVGLVAGTAAIGKLVANDGVDIGDVTINNTSIAVTGTFWQATQPVSLASLPALPTGTNTIGVVNVAPKANSLSNATTTALAAALSVKDTSGTIFRLVGYSNATYEQYIQIHNVASSSSSPPSVNAVPTITFIVPPRSNFSFDFGVYGRLFSNGIYVRNSSAASTLQTASTASDCWFDVMYL